MEKVVSKNDLQQLTQQICAFRDARDWRQFHGIRQLIVSLNLEAAELLELTQWQSDEEIESLATRCDGREALSDEMADVFMYLVLLADRAGVDLGQAVLTKLVKNETKYPVETARGSRAKYSVLKEGNRG